LKGNILGLATVLIAGPIAVNAQVTTLEYQGDVITGTSTYLPSGFVAPTCTNCALPVLPSSRFVGSFTASIVVDYTSWRIARGHAVQGRRQEAGPVLGSTPTPGATQGSHCRRARFDRGHDRDRLPCRRTHQHDMRSIRRSDQGGPIRGQDGLSHCAAIAARGRAVQTLEQG